MYYFLDSIVAPIFWTVFYMSISASIIGAIVFIVRKFADKLISPVWKYAMWGLMVVALIIPFRPQSNVAVITNIPLYIPRENTAITEEIPQTYAVFNEETNESTMVTDFNVEGVVVAGVWMVGMSVMGAIFLRSKLSLMRKIKAGGEVWQSEIITKCKRKIGYDGKVRVYIQNNVNSPAVIGAFRPKILIPSYVTTMSEEKIEHILLHELAHCKRGDMFANALLVVLRVVYWFNPIVWVMFKYIREDMELLNDVFVLRFVSDQKEYSRSLVEVLGLCQNISVIHGALCMTEGAKGVKRRIVMIKMQEKFLKYKVAICVSSLVVILALGVFFLTQGEQSEGISWAQTLNVSDVGQIDVQVLTENSELKHRKLAEDEIASCVSLINSVQGNPIENWSFEGESTTLFVLTKDNVSREIGVVPGEFLNVDGKYYEADKNLLAQIKSYTADGEMPANMMNEGIYLTVNNGEDRTNMAYSQTGFKNGGLHTIPEIDVAGEIASLHLQLGRNFYSGGVISLESYEAIEGGPDEGFGEVDGGVALGVEESEMNYGEDRVQTLTVSNNNEIYVFVSPSAERDERYVAKINFNVSQNIDVEQVWGNLSQTGETVELKGAFIESVVQRDEGFVATLDYMEISENFEPGSGEGETYTANAEEVFEEVDLSNFVVVAYEERNGYINQSFADYVHENGGIMAHVYLTSQGVVMISQMLVP